MTTVDNNHFQNFLSGDKSVKVHAPGTVANLVCGFDILGLCLNEPNDLMEVKLLDEKKNYHSQR
jgi:homoserine kinase